MGGVLRCCLRDADAQSARFAVELASAGGVGLWLAVVVDGWLAGGSTDAGAVLGGADAAESVVFATALGMEGAVGAAPELGVEFSELDAVVLVSGNGVEGSEFETGALGALLVSAATVVFVFAARDDDSRVAWLEVRLLVALLLAVFAGFTLSVAGGETVAGLAAPASPCGVVVSAATGAGALAVAVLASATTAGRFAAGGVLSESLRL